MKAIQVHEHGNADQLRYEEVAVPEPGEGEIRVKLDAVGVNFIDIYHRTGQYPGKLPITPGVEGAGEVDEVGSGVTLLKPGDRVAYVMQPGSYAEYAVVPAWKAVPLPEGISSNEAAGVMLQGMTAHYLCFDSFALKMGDRALVHAAAGGVGLLLVQIAKQRGAWVIGTASTEEKISLAKKHGADEMIQYTQTDFEEAVKDITEGEGVDVVYDSVGASTFHKSLNCLKPRGYMVLYGQSSGAVEPIDPQILNRKGSLFLTRPSLGHHVPNRKALLKRANDLFDWLAAGELQLRIDKSFSLQDAPGAHHYMENRSTKGKILLIP